MKKSRVFLAAVLLALIAVPAMAANAKTGPNKIDMTGDLAKDGRVTFYVDWTLDTAKYPSLNRDAVRDKVSSEIWDKVLAKVMSSTKGMNLAYDKSDFTVTKEHHTLVTKRPNGTKLYALDIEIEFSAPSEAAPPAPAKKPADKGFVLQQRWDNDM
ncbi:MAG: hypothetical protein V2A66_04620 [Pseudomonadota bacterium]